MRSAVEIKLSTSHAGHARGDHYECHECCIAAIHTAQREAFERAAELIEKSPSLFAGHFAGAKRLADGVRDLWREVPR